MNENLIRRCKQEGCKVESTGICLEGYEPDECPHCELVESFDDESVEVKLEDEAESEVEIEEDENDEIVYLHEGDELEIDSVSSLAKQSYINLITLVGAPRCGKTTLLLSIYESFSNGSFSGYNFSGSKSLIGYEKRCFRSRIASGETEPDTDRTIPDTREKFLHLRVKNVDDENAKRNLLFTDISGEIFKRAKDSNEVCLELKSISMCDNFVLLIDGEKLIDRNNRQKAYTDSVMMLRRCFDTKMLSKESNIYVLISKWDLFEGLEDQDKKTEATEFINYIEKDLKDRFYSLFDKIIFDRISARPLKAELPYAYRVDKLFEIWVENLRKSSLSKQSIIRYAKNSNREIDHFLYKYRGGD